MNASFVARREGEWWVLPIVDMEVSRCFLDRGQDFGLLAHHGGGEHTTRLSLGDAVWVSGGGDRVLSTHDVEALSWLMDLSGRTIEGVRASLESRLEVRLSGEVVLAVEANPDVEAWEIRGPGKLLVVAGSGGGGPSIWDDSMPSHRFNGTD